MLIKDKLPKNKILRVILNLSIVIVCLAVATGIAYIFVNWGFKESNTVVFYLLFVFIASLLTKGFVYGLIASVIAIFAYNFFFTSPYFTFAVDDPSYIVTFFVMAFTSISTSLLMKKLQRTAKEARDRELATTAIYKLTSHLSDSESMNDITSFALQTITDTFNCLPAILCFDEKGEPEKSYLQQKSKTEQIHRDTLKPQALKNRMNNLITACDEGEEFYDYPVYAGKRLLAVLRLDAFVAKNFESQEKKLLHSMIESIAIAIDSFVLEKEKEKNRLAAEKEHYRSNLLRSISHDLRTPLSEIIGSSEILMNVSKDNKEVNKLSSEIHESAEWLHSLVENILNLTRLQNGKLTISKTVESIEEIASVAASIIEKRYPGRTIDINLPDEPVFVEIDARLINQVFVNLLDNAVKHTPLDKEIGININVDNINKKVNISVYDGGTGIRTEDLPNLFQPFFTTEKKVRVDIKGGIGLGLSIVQSIVKAHGGTIDVKNRSEGGACFTFTLNIKED